MTPLVYVNGKFVPKAEATVSVFDHGFLYGDGVFEGIRAYNGRVFRLDEHLERLYRGARTIMLDVGMTPEALREAVLESLRVNELRDAYIRLVVSRGVGDLGLDPRKCTQGANVIIIADAIQLYPQEMYEAGLEVKTVVTRRNMPTALNPAIKSLNYLNNIMAKIEVVQAGLHEGLMLSADGYVAEATGDNIFIYSGGTLYTPPTAIGALQGITRDAVMQLAQEMGISVVEKVFNQYEVYIADECFLTGTAAEIIPVTVVDGRKIGAGKPGPVTGELMSRFHALTRKEGVPIS